MLLDKPPQKNPHFNQTHPVTIPFFLSSFLTLPQGMWDHFPWPRIEPVPPAEEAQSLNHWTTKEVTMLNDHFLMTYYRNQTANPQGHTH